MNSVKSYQLCPAPELLKHLTDLDEQCERALDAYRGLAAQRGIVLEALGVTTLQTSVELQIISA